MNNRSVARLAALLCLVGVLTSVLPSLARAAEIGDQVEDLSFKDIRYLPRSLDDFGEQKAYVLFFTNTSCPLVQRYMPTIKKLHDSYADQDVQVPVELGAGSGPGHRRDQSHDRRGHARWGPQRREFRGISPSWGE